MADPESVNGMIDMTGAHAISHENIIVTGQGIQSADIEGSEVNSEAFLQQALVDAPEALVQGTVQQYNVTGNEDLESASVEEQLINSVVTSGAFEAQVTENQSAVFEGATYAVVNSDGVTLDSNVVEQNKIYISTSTIPVEDATQDNQVDVNLSDNGSGEPKGISVTLMPANEASGAPLGSSQNPIRIIQQGNQYTPMQHLTSEQLHQIMQVVQQQQVAKSTSQEGSSILFNPQTNTRIVYRVIYPSELHKTIGSEGINVVGVKRQGQGHQTQTVIIKEGQRKQYKKRLRLEEDEKLDGPDLTKEEKEERKKHRPRTRSGRISKPPKHMVKDYKHIHVLDLEEEEAADDSDGGYSDFKYSDDESHGRIREEKDDDVNFDSGMTLKPKKYKCKSCQKAYVGRGGLSRHYKLFPLHGSIEDHIDLGDASPNKFVQNGVNITGNISEDSNTQDSTSSTPPTITTVRRNNYYRGGFRGRWTNHETAAAKRRNKLKDLMKQCQDEELMEIVLPRLTKVITLWEFLLMKVENKKTLRPNMLEIYQEFESLAKQIEKICKNYLQPSTDTEVESNSMHNKLRVQEEGVGQAIGLKAGVYDVKDLTLQDHSTFHYKLLTTDIENIQKSPNQSVKRTVEVVSHEQLLSPAKKVKTVLSENSAYKTNKITISPQLTPSGRQKNSITVVHHPIKVAATKKPTVVSIGSSVLPGTTILQNSLSSSSSSALSSSSSPAPLIIQPVSQSSSNGILSVKSGSGSQQLRINNSNVVSSSILVNPHSSGIMNSNVQTTPTVVNIQQNTMSNIKVMNVQPNQSVGQIVTSGISLLPPNLRSVADSGSLQSASNSTNVTTSFTNSVTSKPGTKVVRIVSSDIGLLNALPNLNASDILNLVNSATVSNSIPCFASNTPVSTSDTSIVEINAPSNELNHDVNTSVISHTVNPTVINHNVNPTVINHNVNASSPAVVVKNELVENQENVIDLHSLQENSQHIQNDEENESESFVTANFINSTDSDILQVKEPESQSLLNSVCENVNACDTDQTMVEIIDPGSVDNQQESQMVQLVDTPMLTGDDIQDVQVTDDQVITASNIYQTSEGIIIIQNEDGSTVQLQGGDGEPIPLETVQALLAMDADGQLLQAQDDEEAMDQ